MRPHRPLLVAVLTTLTCLGCGSAPTGGRTPDLRPNSGKAAVPAPNAARAGTVLTTTATPDGTVLVELDLGGRVAMEAGLFFRLHPASDASALLGVVQITEVLAAERCVGRVLGITDRTRPPAPGDRAIEIADLAALGAEAEAENRRAAAGQSAAEREAEARFSALRTQYRAELAQLIARHDAALAASASRAALVQQELRAEREAALLRERERAAADLAAARLAFDAEQRASLERERERAAKRSAAVDDEVRRLQAQVESLLGAAAAQQARLDEAERVHATAQQLATARLRAEVEAREALAVQLAALEGRAAPALITDTRSEPVLDQLARLRRALDDALARERLLAVQRTSSASAAESAAAERDAALHELARLRDIETAVARSAHAASAASEDARAARSAAAAAELARLEAERSLYDLAARILRLPSGAIPTAASSTELAALQARLRTLAGAGATP